MSRTAIMLSNTIMTIMFQLKPNKTAFSGLGWIGVDVVELWEGEDDESGGIDGCVEGDLPDVKGKVFVSIVTV